MGWADVASPVLALGAGLPLAWRRSHPRLVTAVVMACYAGLVVVQGLVPPWAAWVLVWSLATDGADRRGSTRLSAAAALTTGLLIAGGELLDPGSGPLVILLAVTAVVALVAMLVRSDRGRVEEARRRATVEERLRIARDLHDLVGHGLSAIAMQSSSARLALAAGDTETAQRGLAAVESSSRAAMREMRQMLDLLADTVGPGLLAAQEPSAVVSRAPSPGVGDIGSLVDNVRAGGVVVSLEDSGVWARATPTVQLCAYRVVQEGLTNAVKHAPECPVTVHLTTTGDSGRVSVETHGAPARDRESTPGRGLDGLRTRVLALNGDFWSGPTPRGWLVEAHLPLDGGEVP
jgi:signal transduction histidine kinase